MHSAHAVFAVTSGILLTACGYWKVTPLTPAEFVAQEKPDRIQVVHHTAQPQLKSTVLYYPAVVSDTLVGDTVWRANAWEPPATRVTIPIADVVSVSARAIQPARSILLGVGIATIVAIWVLIEYSGHLFEGGL